MTALSHTLFNLILCWPWHKEVPNPQPDTWDAGNPAARGNWELASDVSGALIADKPPRAVLIPSQLPAGSLSLPARRVSSLLSVPLLQFSYRCYSGQ